MIPVLLLKADAEPRMWIINYYQSASTAQSIPVSPIAAALASIKCFYWCSAMTIDVIMVSVNALMHTNCLTPFESYCMGVTT